MHFSGFFSFSTFAQPETNKNKFTYIAPPPVYSTAGQEVCAGRTGSGAERKERERKRADLRPQLPSSTTHRLQTQCLWFNVCQNLGTRYPLLNVSPEGQCVYEMFTSPTFLASSARDWTCNPQLTKPTSYESSYRDWYVMPSSFPAMREGKNKFLFKVLGWKALYMGTSHRGFPTMLASAQSLETQPFRDACK